MANEAIKIIETAIKTATKATVKTKKPLSFLILIR